MTILWLNNSKVAKLFGTRPHLGRRIRLYTKRITTGNLAHKVVFGREIPDKDAFREVSVALKPVRGQPGFFKVMCEPQYREMIEMWCVDNLREDQKALSKRELGALRLIRKVKD